MDLPRRRSPTDRPPRRLPLTTSLPLPCPLPPPLPPRTLLPPHPPLRPPPLRATSPTRPPGTANSPRSPSPFVVVELPLPPLAPTLLHLLLSPSLPSPSSPPHFLPLLLPPRPFVASPLLCRPLAEVFPPSGPSAPDPLSPVLHPWLGRASFEAAAVTRENPSSMSLVDSSFASLLFLALYCVLDGLPGSLVASPSLPLSRDASCSVPSAFLARPAPRVPTGSTITILR